MSTAAAARAGSITELWGVWDRHWNAVLVRVWLLSAGGWSCASWARRSWLCACMGEKEGGKQKKDNRSCARGKPLLELHVCSIRHYYTQKLTQLHDHISQGGRFSFDLDLSLHSLHAERFKGRVSIWLASAGWGEDLAERSGICNTHSTHTKQRLFRLFQLFFRGHLN